MPKVPRRPRRARPLPKPDLNAATPELIRSESRRIRSWLAAAGAGIADLFCVYLLISQDVPAVLILIVPLSGLTAYACLSAGACVIADPGRDSVVVKNAFSTTLVPWATVQSFTIVQRRSAYRIVKCLVLERIDGPRIRLAGLGQSLVGAPDASHQSALARLQVLESSQQELNRRLLRHQALLRDRAAEAAAAGPAPPAEG